VADTGNLENFTSLRQRVMEQDLVAGLGWEDESIGFGIGSMFTDDPLFGWNGLGSGSSLCSSEPYRKEPYDTFSTEDRWPI